MQKLTTILTAAAVSIGTTYVMDTESPSPSSPETHVLHPNVYEGADGKLRTNTQARLGSNVYTTDERVQTIAAAGECDEKTAGSVFMACWSME